MAIQLVITIAGFALSLLGIIWRFNTKFTTMDVNLKNMEKNHCHDFDQLEKKIQENKQDTNNAFTDIKKELNKIENYIIELLQVMPKRNKD